MQFCLFVEGMRAKRAKESRQCLFRAQELRDSVVAGGGLIGFGTVLKRDGSASSTLEMRLDSYLLGDELSNWFGHRHDSNTAPSLEHICDL